MNLVREIIMKVALIQISDVHLRSINNRIDKKLDMFVNRLSHQLAKNEKVIFLLTGDIANSGKEVEFNVAKRFFGDIKSKLEDLSKNLDLSFELVPGNHDIDLSTKDVMRDATIKHIKDINGVIDEKALNYLLSFQSSFFEFSNSINENYSKPFIFRSSRYNLEGFSLNVDCLNTSILSTLNEIPDTLFLLNFDDIKNRIKETKPDFRILLMHHPLHWLNHTVRNEYIDFLNKNYDAIFFGHEHNLNEYTRSSVDCDVSINSAGAFNDNESNESFFVIHKLNFGDKTYDRQSYSWKDEAYRQTNDYERPIVFNNKGINRLTLSSNILNEVNKLGIQIYKKDQSSLFSLDDLFTAPRYELIKPIKNNEETAETKKISYEELLKLSYLLIVGEFRSGKSTLLKKIFKNEYFQKRKPLILSGSEIKEHSNKFYEKVVFNKIIEHYEENQQDNYNNLHINERTLIIDDIHLMKNFDDRLLEFIDFAKCKFSKVVFSISYEEFNKQRLENRDNLGFYQIMLKEFQREERLKLYNNWYDHYCDYSKDEKLSNIELAESTIDSIIGNKLIKSTPETVTLLLYQIKNISMTDSDIYSKLYDYIIMKSLNSLNLSEIEIKIILKFLYLVAFKMFINKNKSITSELFKNTILEFTEYYFNNLNYEKTKKILLDANIIRKIDEDTFEFEYTFYYYYLLSKYFVDFLKSPEAYIDDLINNLFKEDSFNLLVFYCYVGDTNYLFKKLRDVSNSFYEEYNVFDLNQKINDNIEYNFEEIKGSIEYDKSYEEIRERKIEIVRRKDEIDENYRNDSNLNDDLSNNILKLIRVNQLLGVIINSYGGTIPSNELIPTISSIYRMNFRFLDFLLRDHNRLGNTLIRNLKEEIENNDKIIDEAKLKKMVNNFLYQIYLTYALFAIEITSTAICSPIYIEKYSDLKNEFIYEVNLELIQSCIKLVHLHANSIMSAINLSQKYFDRKDAHLIIFLRMFCNEYFNHRSIQDNLLKDKYKNSKICKRIEVKFNEVG